MFTALKLTSRPSGGSTARLALIGLNVVLLGGLGVVLLELFRPAEPEAPIPNVVPVELALADDGPAPEFGDLVALVRAQLDAPLPEPPPAAPPAPATPGRSALHGWEVIALLQRPGTPATAILTSAGGQVTLQVGDTFLGGEVRSIAVDVESGDVRLQVEQGETTSELTHRFAMQ